MKTDITKPLALICGAGAGLGAALCVAFAEKGYQVVCLNRSPSSAHVDGVDSRTVDCANADAVNSVLDEIFELYGVPQVYIHNPAHLVIKELSDTSAFEFEASWRSMVFSAYTVLHRILPRMAEKETGCVIVSGATASIRGSAKFSAFASAKFALRGLTQSVAREYRTHGIHVVHVILDGIIDTPRSRELHSINPAKMILADELAAVYLQLAGQARSVWTHELDLRPQSESF